MDWLWTATILEPPFSSTFQLAKVWQFKTESEFEFEISCRFNFSYGISGRHVGHCFTVKSRATVDSFNSLPDLRLRTSWYHGNPAVRFLNRKCEQRNKQLHFRFRFRGYFVYEWPIVVLNIVGRCSSTGTLALCYIFSAEIFPTVVRNVGIGSSSVWVIKLSLKLQFHLLKIG